MATLLDRFIGPDGELKIRAQTESGQCITITVPDEYADDAGALWGGDDVHYVVVDGRRMYEPLYPLDTWTDADDHAASMAAARRLAPGAADADIEQILLDPMSHSQRRAALCALSAGSLPDAGAGSLPDTGAKT